MLGLLLRSVYDISSLPTELSCWSSSVFFCWETLEVFLERILESLGCSGAGTVGVTVIVGSWHFSGGIYSLGSATNMSTSVEDRLLSGNVFFTLLGTQYL